MNKIIYAIAVMFLVCAQACGGVVERTTDPPTENICAQYSVNVFATGSVLCSENTASSCVFGYDGSPTSLQNADDVSVICNCESGLYYCKSVHPQGQEDATGIPQMCEEIDAYYFENKLVSCNPVTAPTCAFDAGNHAASLSMNGNPVSLVCNCDAEGHYVCRNHESGN